MITVAKTAGFCPGVKRAVMICEKACKENKKPIYVYGDLVHNSNVVKHFSDMGLRTVYDIDDFNSLPNGKVIVRSHGISAKEEEKIKRNHEIIDATCIFVKRIHNSVEEFSKKGYNIVIVGDGAHPEVKGISGRAVSCVSVINSTNEAENIAVSEPLFVVSQTTNRKDNFYKIIAVLKRRFKDLIYLDTICNATKERQEECKELAKESDIMIVIGGRNSSNSNKLYEIAKENCSKSYFIETKNELNISFISPKIGITAGASTPDGIIKEVVMTMNGENGNEMSMEVVDNSFHRIHKGDVIKGKVLYVNENEVSVNINYKSDGIISREEISNDIVDPRTMFEPGQEIDVYVLKVDDGDGMVILSYKKVMEGQLWEELEKKFENNETLECNVISPIKGGLSVSVNGIRGFMPASQVELFYVEDFSKYKGQTLPCRIIDFDKAKKRLVVSKKVLDKEEKDAKLNELWESLEEGQIVHGRVERLVDFGAFVDIGGIDGLIHISDLTWNRIRKPSEVLKVGQEIDTKILAIDKERSRVSLGLKQTQEEPWTVFMRNNHVGDIVEGKVVSILDFGAFVTLDSGVDGLLHVSQISKEHIEKPSDVLKEGEMVQVKITEINEEKRKISLSIRAIKPGELEGESSDTTDTPPEIEDENSEEYQSEDVSTENIPEE